MFFGWHSRGHEGDEGRAGPPPKAMKAIKAIKDMARRRAADGSATGPARPRMYDFLEGGTDGQRNDLQSRFLEIGPPEVCEPSTYKWTLTAYYAFTVVSFVTLSAMMRNLSNFRPVRLLIYGGAYSVTNCLSTLGSLRTYRPGDGAHLRYS